MERVTAKFREGMGDALKGMAVGNIFQQQLLFATDFANVPTGIEDLAHAVMLGLPDTLTFPEPFGFPKVAEIQIDSANKLLIFLLFSSQAAVFLIVDSKACIKELCEFFERHREDVEREVRGMML